MSRYVLELLDSTHDRRSFASGLASVDSYLKETARGHTEKGISLTRVLIHADAEAPKPILGYFTLTPCMVEAAGWPTVPKGLPRNPVGAVLLRRFAMDISMQNQGIASRLLALARSISASSLRATGGIGNRRERALTRYERRVPCFRSVWGSPSPRRSRHPDPTPRFGA